MFQTSFDPSKTAILVVDMQQGYTDPSYKHAFGASKNTDRLAIRLKEDFLPKARQAGLRILWARHVPHPNNSLPFDKGFTRFHQCEPQANEFIIDKISYSAFDFTNLEMILKQEGISHLALVGAFTDVCIRDTARDGVFSGLENVTVIRDLCVDIPSHSSEQTDKILEAMTWDGIDVADSKCFLSYLARTPVLAAA